MKATLQVKLEEVNGMGGDAHRPGIEPAGDPRPEEGSGPCPLNF